MLSYLQNCAAPCVRPAQGKNRSGSGRSAVLTRMPFFCTWNRSFCFFSRPLLPSSGSFASASDSGSPSLHLLSGFGLNLRYAVASGEHRFSDAQDLPQSGKKQPGTCNLQTHISGTGSALNGSGMRYRASSSSACRNLRFGMPPPEASASAWREPGRRFRAPSAPFLCKTPLPCPGFFLLLPVLRQPSANANQLDGHGRQSVESPIFGRISRPRPGKETCKQGAVMITWFAEPQGTKEERLCT